jgi:hypothetical protein
MLKFFAFCLDSCIVNKGEKFELVLGFWMHLEGFQVVLSHFWALLHTCLTGQSAGTMHMLSTGLTVGGDRSDRSNLSCYSCSVSCGVLHAFVQGSCIGSGGACMCAGGALCGFRALVWWFALFA